MARVQVRTAAQPCDRLPQRKSAKGENTAFFAIDNRTHGPYFFTCHQGNEARQQGVDTMAKTTDLVTRVAEIRDTLVALLGHDAYVAVDTLRNCPLFSAKDMQLIEAMASISTGNTLLVHVC